jgi:hypothetical protein
LPGCPEGAIRATGPASDGLTSNQEAAIGIELAGKFWTSLLKLFDILPIRFLPLTAAAVPDGVRRSFEDGLLIVDPAREIPEATKPRRIPIANAGASRQIEQKAS